MAGGRVRILKFFGPCDLFYQLVVNVEKYLPQKGQVCKNNSSLTALVIFADLSHFGNKIYF